MNFELFRTIAALVGIPVLKRDEKGNASLSVDDETRDIKLGKGAPTQLSGSRTLEDDDDGLILINMDAGDVILTLPVGLVDGFSCSMIQGEDGTVGVVAGEDCFIDNRSGFTKTAGIHAMIGIVPAGLNRYVLVGDGQA